MEIFIKKEEQIDLEEYLKEVQGIKVNNHVIDDYFNEYLINGNKRSFTTKEQLYKVGDSINLYCNNKCIALVKLVFVLPIKIVDNEVFIHRDNIQLPLDLIAVNYEGFGKRKKEFFKFYKNNFEGYINFFNYIKHRYLKQ